MTGRPTAASHIHRSRVLKRDGFQCTWGKGRRCEFTDPTGADLHVVGDSENIDKARTVCRAHRSELAPDPA